MQYNANPNPPQRSRKSGGKWGWIVLIIVAVILFRSGLVRRIIDGVQNFGESLFSFDLSVESEAPKPDAHSNFPGSGALSLFTDTVTVGDSALVNYRDAALDYREDGAYTLDAAHAQNFELFWPAGTVSIRPYDGDAVEIRESAEGGISEDQALRFGMDGTTFFVQYCTLGAAYAPLPAKDLTILLPRALADAALFTKLETGASVLTIEDLALTDGTITASSGSITADGLRAYGALTVSTASGSAEIAGEIGELKFSSSSGALRFAGGETLATLDLSSTSGGITVSGNIHRIAAQTTSGRVEIASPICPYTLKAETTSGDISLYLPDDADFTLDFSSVSGTLRSKLTVEEQGGSYIRGDGIARFAVTSSSGNLQLLPYAE